MVPEQGRGFRSQGRFAETSCDFIIEHVLLVLGVMKESGARLKGLIEIPNLSEENDVDDTEVRI